MTALLGLSGVALVAVLPFLLRRKLRLADTTPIGLLLGNPRPEAAFLAVYYGMGVILPAVLFIRNDDYDAWTGAVSVIAGPVLAMALLWTIRWQERTLAGWASRPHPLWARMLIVAAVFGLGGVLIWRIVTY